MDERFDSEPTARLDLPERAEDLPSVLPKRMVQNLRYYRRRAAQTGEVAFAQADAADALPFFKTLASLHGVRWSARGYPGVLADEDVLAFHRAAVPALANAGLLRLYALRIDRQPAAALYAITAKQTSAYYIGGFDPRFAALSPGTLLIGHAIERAIDEGCRAFDFLNGVEVYKSLWDAAIRPSGGRRQRCRGQGGAS